MRFRRVVSTMLSTKKFALLAPICLAVLLLAYNEWLVYYVVLWSCSWPVLRNETDTLRVMLLADTHLLGEKRGHWFDKLRREWQMYRSFQSAQTLFSPDVVFVLGDLFDEGDFATSDQFQKYVNRFEQLFYVDESKTKRYTAVGNHDVGFHYAMSPARLGRFNGAFSEHQNGSAVEVLQLRGQPFVLVNSMAMANDGCSLCEGARRTVVDVGKTLRCLQDERSQFGTYCAELERHFRLTPPYAAPILLQHFPLYRASDAACDEPDGAPAALKSEPMRELWECLSRESSQFLVDTLRPRAAFGGHSHYGCTTWHPASYNQEASASPHGTTTAEAGFTEWTLSSFSWRNNVRPAFLLMALNGSQMSVNKCQMPRETTVVAVYMIGAGVVCVLLLNLLYVWCCAAGASYKRKRVYSKLSDSQCPTD